MLESKELAQINGLLRYLTDAIKKWTTSPDSISTISLFLIHFKAIQARKVASLTMSWPSLTGRRSDASTNRRSDHGETFLH